MATARKATDHCRIVIVDDVDLDLAKAAIKRALGTWRVSE